MHQEQQETIGTLFAKLKRKRQHREQLASDTKATKAFVHDEIKPLIADELPPVLKSVLSARGPQ